jgi:NAD(P)-dependent dehydrogenase (short-subunit alcohol dehydrogenase family)
MPGSWALSPKSKTSKHAVPCCESALSGAMHVHAFNLQPQLRTRFVICRELEDLKHVLLTNVVGTFAVTKAFLPLLKSGKKRTIINMSSDAGCLTQNASFINDDRPSDAGMALSYRASKVAVNMGKLAPRDFSLAEISIMLLHWH